MFGWPVARQCRYTVLSVSTLDHPCSDIPAALGSDLGLSLTGELFA